MSNPGKRGPGTLFSFAFTASARPEGVQDGEGSQEVELVEPGVERIVTRLSSHTVYTLSLTIRINDDAELRDDSIQQSLEADRE